jgi:dephospho-CoA kinase
VIVVGLTGGIGAGKSTVAALLADRGAVVVDLDAIARQLAAPGGASYDALVGQFGPDVVLPGGALDRSAIATKVFADPAQLAALNAITHPAIAIETARRVSEQAGGSAIVVLDIPLLDETSRHTFALAGVIVVDAPVELALQRLVDHRGLTESDARARVKAQISREDRRRLADVVIDNSGTRADLEVSMGPLWAWLRGLQGAPIGPSPD